MSKLSDIAKKAVGDGSVTSGLEYIKLDDIIEQYPGGVCITGAGFVNGADGSNFPVFTFLEDPSRYFGGGQALRAIAEAWLEFHDGDIEAVNADLKAEPVCVKMRKVTTKTRKTYTQVLVVSS